MIVNSPQLILQNNYLKPISEGEPVITPKSTGGDVQPPPNIQSQEAVTYARDSSGLNYFKPISEGEPLITPKSTGGDVQPPPNIQSQKAATYVRDSSGLISSELNDGHKTQDGHTSISISV